MVKFSLIPREEKFFTLFEESVQNMVQAAQSLKDMIETWEHLEATVAEITDVVDFIHAAADAMLIYKVDRPGERARELADIIVQEAAEVEKAMPLLRSRPGLKQIPMHCVEINRLENMADRVFRSAMGELFENTTDMSYVIKWREIYEHLESATDRGEDVANVLEGVALTYA